MIIFQLPIDYLVGIHQHQLDFELVQVFLKKESLKTQFVFNLNDEHISC